MLLVFGLPARSLPHRQLRKMRQPRVAVCFGSLPHRQLRKQWAKRTRAY
ncbi:hypothetical protein P20652_3831 [Pseudoalteromonas sp. BSi20652]|nr:hypothetical protein P20652_3831 [Pseudoalteromonas sp. BSi20652]